MKLQRDILIVDFESFGDDLEKSQIVRLVGIVIDKDSLLTKNIRQWYLKHSWLASVAEAHARFLGIEVPTILAGTKPLETAKEFESVFAGNVILAVPNFQKFVTLRYFYRKLSLPFPFDAQTLDLQSIYQLFGLKYGWRKIPSLSSLAEYYGKRLKNVHDPLERAKLHAEIFIKILTAT